MKVYPSRDILPFVMYCVNGKPRSSLLIESTDSMIESTDSMMHNNIGIGRKFVLFFNLNLLGCFNLDVFYHTHSAEHY